MYTFPCSCVFRPVTPWQAFDLLSSSLETEAELQVLLGLLPESKGGAGILALGLLSTCARHVCHSWHLLRDGSLAAFGARGCVYLTAWRCCICVFCFPAHYGAGALYRAPAFINVFEFLGTCVVLPWLCDCVAVAYFAHCGAGTCLIC